MADMRKRAAMLNEKIAWQDLFLKGAIFFRDLLFLGGFGALYQSERQTMVAASPPMAKKAMLQRDTKVPPIA